MDAYFAAFNPSTGKPEIYQQKVLPFGSVASVTAFLRVSNALWKIGTKLLNLMWSAYFDDFFSITEATSSKHTDLIVSAFFSILGWRLSHDKLVDYSTICKVLGVQFDLRMSGAGLAYVANTNDRVVELCENLDEVVETKQLSKVDGERLRGRSCSRPASCLGEIPEISSGFCPCTDNEAGRSWRMTLSVR